ncbi:hypothetical protein U14_03765 [Candidatus Moduliflexus flocculans]|uniref:Uncharacterized protein n=1 Tax=Candidatus Moduliflexus flocculans TaxID=1499966 RepID=A0A081BQ48_9BACT|nr:hypothetical protein U14_03765 [Candidatus Moduliflexus flocculans]
MKSPCIDICHIHNHEVRSNELGTLQKAFQGINHIQDCSPNFLIEKMQPAQGYHH